MACNSILNEIDKQFLNNNENTVVIDDDHRGLGSSASFFNPYIASSTSQLVL